MTPISLNSLNTDKSKADTQALIACIVGTRPNFVKIAPIMRALHKHPKMKPWLIHTGQHYDVNMSKAFFSELDIPKPDENLEAGSGTATQQTAEIIVALEALWTERRPKMVLVVGDVNSTFAAALVAVRLGIPVIHVESGLRSGDRGMPEEINRIMTDAISDLLFTSERLARKNLNAEGIPDEKIIFAGNVMIDSLHACLERAVSVSETLAAHDASEAVKAKISETGFILATMHRPSNVDDNIQLKRHLDMFVECAKQIPLIFPLHPRTRNAIEANGFMHLLETPNILILPPASYLTIIGLMREAKVVITDSGGIQEETTALGVPCLTIRENTERPTTITEGTNVLVSDNLDGVPALVADILKTGGKSGRIPELWDGKTAERIVEHLSDHLSALTKTLSL